MYKTVEKETKEINLEDLINGRPAALLHVHTAGMLALVTGEEEYPETLSFDEYRLDLLRAEYRYLCLSSSMLATLSNTVRHQQVVHYSHSSDHHQHEEAKQVLLSTVTDMLVAGAPRDMDIEKAVSDICDFIEHDQKQTVRLNLLQSVIPTNAVHVLM